MHVLMIMNGKGIGGAELQFIELANRLVKNHQVTLVSMQGSLAVECGRLAEAVVVRCFPYSSKLNTAMQCVSAIVSCRMFPADVIVTTSFVGDMVGVFARSGKAQRLNSLQTISGRKRRMALDKKILRRFDTLIAGCQDIRTFLVEHGQDPERIVVVNNWVDFSARITTEESNVTRSRYGYVGGEKIIGCIGRMHHQKGQEYLIRAFRKVSDKFPSARLVLVGDGPRMEEMKVEAGSHPHIHFTGTVTDPEYTNLLAMFDAYVQPSRYEGLPRTLLDAMYMKLPVIASAVNGNLDVLRDGKNGLLVPPEDVDSISTALDYLLSNPEIASGLAMKAAVDVNEGFSMEVQTAKVEETLFG